MFAVPQGTAEPRLGITGLGDIRKHKVSVPSKVFWLSTCHVAGVSSNANALCTGRETEATHNKTTLTVYIAVPVTTSTDERIITTRVRLCLSRIHRLHKFTYSLTAHETRKKNWGKLRVF
jgi:hypothetical protein